MPHRATQDGRVMVESSDKTWSTGEGEPHEQYEYVYTHITQLAEITLPYSKILLAFKSNFSIVVVQLNCVWFFVAPWTAVHQASLAFTISQSLFKLMSIESVILFNHLILYFPLLLLPSNFPSITVFSSKLDPHIRWPKDYSLSFSISHFNEYSGLISFRIGWFDLLAVQGTQESLQHHNSKALILWHSAFFMVQLSHPYMTTRLLDYMDFDYMDFCWQSDVSA